MDNASQRRALRNYRSRLTERGLARFDVIGRDADRALIRSLARQLADDGPVSDELRASVHRSLSAGRTTKGGILHALLRSPLVGSGIDLARSWEDGRTTEQ